MARLLSARGRAAAGAWGSRSLLLSPGHYVVLGASDLPWINGDASVSYSYSGAMALSNNSDELILSRDELEIDRIAWDNGASFPDPTGASMSLDPSALDAADNDDGTLWCESTTRYGDGDKGTPAAVNESCF